MTVLVRISDTPVSHIRGSLEWDEALTGRTMLSGILYDDDGSLDIDRYEFVEVEDADSGDRLWAGHVVETNATRIGTSDAYEVELDAVDLSGLADRVLAAKGYVDTTAGAIVNDLLTNYLTDEDVAAGQIDTGPDVGDARVRYRPVGEFLDSLADETNAVWKIDKFRRLQWYDLDKVDRSAPQDLTLDLIERKTVNIKRSNPEYRNVQVIRGIEATTDPRTEVMPGQDDGSGSGSQSYATSFPIHEEPTVEVDRNGDGSYVTETVGVRGIEDTTQWYWSKGEAEVVRDSDTTAVTESGNIRVTYVGQYDALVRVKEAPEVDRVAGLDTASGKVEAATERTDVRTINAGFEKAGQLLLRFGGEDDVRVEFNTREPGYEAGQVCSLDVPGFSGQVRLESVTAKERASGNLTYSIKASQGPIRGKWTELWYRALRPDQTFVDQVGENEIVALLETFDADTTDKDNPGWSATTSDSVETCAILNPSTPMPFTLC